MALPSPVPKKRKRIDNNTLFSKMMRKANTETRRQITRYDQHYREFGNSNNQDTEESEPVTPRRSMMMVLQEMIIEKSPLLVITSAVADAETDYESVITKQQQNMIINTTLPEPKARLWPHQEEAVRFIGSRELDLANTGCRGLMLCDDMGLGKTLETLMYIYRHTQQRQRETGRRFNGVSLIVIPCILIDTWVKEIEKSFPPNSLHYVKMMGDKTTVPDKAHIENCTDIIFTTYTVVSIVYKALYGNNTNTISNTENEVRACDGAEDLLQPENVEFIKHRYQVLFQIKFLRIVPDEAHYIANPYTDRFKAMKQLKAVSNWYNTGTPIQNSYRNIYSCFDFIRVPLQGVLTTIASTGTDGNILVSAEDELYMKNLLDKVMIRRLKHQIMGSIDRPFFLCHVDRQIVSVDFRSEAERILYLLYATHGKSRMHGNALKKKRGLFEGERNFNITSMIQLMRQCCIDFHILRSAILPNGMLLGLNTGTLKPKVTSFGERLFYDESCHYEHIERDNTELEYSAFKHNHKTAYNYESADKEVKRSYEWNPYATGTLFSESDSFGKQLYGTVYELMSDASEKNGISSIKEKICEILGLTESDTLLDEQIEKIHSHLERRILPRYSTKQLECLEYIQRIEDPTDKVIICSDSVLFLRSMGACLTEHGISSCMVAGDIRKNDNESQISQFRRDPSMKVLLMSLKKGCVGLNIPEANHMLFPSPWWNPHGLLQAECRLQRIGQTKSVHIRQFVICDTMEEYMLDLSTYKKNISDQLIDNQFDETDDTVEAINASIDETTRSRLFGYTLNVEYGK